jgi:predicted RNA-binding protein
MSCDQYFERCLQNKFDAVSPPKNESASHEMVSAAPHRLVGADVWLDAFGKQEIFLEGVIEIEFHEGKLVFQTVLGETLVLQGQLEGVILREGKLVLQTE